MVAAAVGLAAGETVRAPYGEALRLLPDAAPQGRQRRRHRGQAVTLLVPQPGGPGEAGAFSRPQGRRQRQRRQQVRDIRQVHSARQTPAQRPGGPVSLQGVPAQPRDLHGTAQGGDCQPEGGGGPVRLRLHGNRAEPLLAGDEKAAGAFLDDNAAPLQHRQGQVHIRPGGQGAGQNQLRVRRQARQGHQQAGNQLGGPASVHRDAARGKGAGDPQTVFRGRKAPITRQGPGQQPPGAGEPGPYLAPGHGQGQKKPQGAAAGPAVDDRLRLVIQGPQAPDRGQNVVGGVRGAGELPRLGQADQLPVQQAFGGRRRHRAPQRGGIQAQVHHSTSSRDARGTAIRRPAPARSATAMVT